MSSVDDLESELEDEDAGEDSRFMRVGENY